MNATVTNDISRAGLKLAGEIARVYSGDHRVRAVIVGGSVSRGSADAHSDLEIGVFWDTPPSDAEWREAVRRMGGETEIWSFGAFGGGKASENIGLSGFTIGPNHYRGTAMVSPMHTTVETTERCIEALIDDLDTDPRNYGLASAIHHGTPLYGHDLVGKWKRKVASFPDRLAVKLVQHNMWLGPWFRPNAYAARADHLVLAQHLVTMQQSIVNVLAALNRTYVPSPEHKWVDWLIDGLPIKPADCAARLKATFATGDLGQAARELIEMGLEVIDLVELHLPEVDEMSLFDGHPHVGTSWARRRWDPYPAYTLMDNIARCGGQEQQTT